MEMALLLTDSEADLLRRVLEKVKRTTFEKSETKLNDMEALEILVSYFEGAQKTEPVKEAPKIPTIPKSKRLFLGHVIGRQVSADTPSGGADP